MISKWGMTMGAIGFSEEYHKKGIGVNTLWPMTAIESYAVINNKLGNSIRQEAIAALQSLGFQKNTIVKKVDAVLSKNPQIQQVEDLLKQVLKLLS